MIKLTQTNLWSPYKDRKNIHSPSFSQKCYCGNSRPYRSAKHKCRVWTNMVKVAKQRIILASFLVHRRGVRTLGCSNHSLIKIIHFLHQLIFCIVTWGYYLHSQTSIWIMIFTEEKHYTEIRKLGYQTIYNFRRANILDDKNAYQQSTWSNKHWDRIPIHDPEICKLNLVLDPSYFQYQVR